MRGELLRHVPRGAHLTLALSGGVDSVALLDILAPLALERRCALDCLHVNHGLSANAPDWARFARAAARRYGVRCTVKRADLSPYRGRGLEGAARAARYAIFARARTDFIVLAQHQDDQAETVLLQLVRGAGVAGLAAMPEMRRPAIGPTLLRPLLGASRTEIETYANQRGLDWVEDESNADERLARNLVRRQIMPMLRELNPRAPANLARSAAHLAEASELARALGEIDARTASRDGRLSIAALRSLPRPRAKNALRWQLAAAGLGPVETTRTEEILEQLLAARADAQVCVAVGGREVRRFDGLVWIVPRQHRLVEFRARWGGERDWRLPALGGMLSFKRTRGAGLARAALANGTVEVRTRRGGERLRLGADRPRRTLKHLLQEAKIPPWERSRLPLLYCDGKLAFVPGVGIDASLQARSGEPGVLVSWRPNAEESSE